MSPATEINPGILRTVAWLNAVGFETVDSGDGVTHDFPCDRDVGFVAIMASPTTLVSEAARLANVLQSRGVVVVPNGNDEGCTIEASYDPADGSAVIVVSRITDADVQWPSPPLRLWLDDQRKPPWGYDLHAKTAEECIGMLERYGDAIVHASLDHDLAEEHYVVLAEGEILDRSAFKEKTGFAVLQWMGARGAWVPDISVHTLSPHGAADMLFEIELRAPSHVTFRRVKPSEV